MKQVGSNPKSRKRTTVSNHTRQLLLLESGYKCASPTCRHVLTLELHHITWVKDGGGNEPDNLIALCPNCHALHTKGHIPVEAIVTWKSLLLSLNNHNRGTADLLLVLYREQKRVAATDDPSTSPPPFRFTGDGLGMLSGLMTSGLLEISQRFSGGGHWFGGGGPSYEVRLTEAGIKLVEAWLDGQLGAVQRALHGDRQDAGAQAVVS